MSLILHNIYKKQKHKKKKERDEHRGHRPYRLLSIKIHFQRYIFTHPVSSYACFGKIKREKK